MQVIQEKNKRIVRLEMQLMNAQREIQNFQPWQQAGSLNFEVDRFCEWARVDGVMVMSIGSKGEVKDFWRVQKKQVKDHMEQSSRSRQDLASVFSFRLREELLEMSRYKLQQLEEFSVPTADRRIYQFELNLRICLEAIQSLSGIP